MWALRVRFSFVFVALMLVSLSGGAVFHVFAADEGEAVAAIAAAEGRIVACHDAVLEAESAGANVSVLTATLEDAGMFLSWAELAYRMGDFDSAVGNASLSQNVLDGFIAEAQALTERAVQDYFWDFSVNVVGSLVGSGVVVCCGFVVWFSWKKRQSGGGGE